MQSVKARSDKWSFELLSLFFLQSKIYLAQCCSFFGGHHAWLHNPTFFLSPLSKHSLGSTARGCLALYIDLADVNDYSTTTTTSCSPRYRTNNLTDFFFLHISGFWPMESKGWCFPYYGSILWTHNNENDSKNVFIGRNTISLLDRPRKDVIEEGNKPFIFLCVLFSSHHLWPSSWMG